MQTGHVHQTCEDNGERQAKTRATEGRNEEEGKSMARGGRKEILVSSDNQTQKARTRGPTYHPKIHPRTYHHANHHHHPSSPALPSTTSEIYTFLPVQSFPTVWVLVLAGGFIQCIFDNVVGHLPLFFYINHMLFLGKNQTSLSASRADYLRRQLVLVPLDAHLKVLI